MSPTCKQEEAGEDPDELVGTTLEVALTLPRDFAKKGDEFTVPLDRSVAPTTVNLYQVSDQGLRDLGLIVGSPQTNTLPPIMRLLKAPFGNAKTLTLRQGLKLAPSTIKLIKDSGIEVESLPYHSNTKEFFDKVHLEDHHLRLLIKLYTETLRLEGYRFQLGQYMSSYNSEWQVPMDGGLINILNTYANLTKTKNGDAQIERLDSKHPLRKTLTQISKNPETISKFVQIFTMNLCTAAPLLNGFDYVETLPYLEKFNQACIKPLRDFIPDYNDSHYVRGILREKAQKELIIFVERGSRTQSLWASMNRSQLFLRFMATLSGFEKEEQPLLLNRLLPLLNLDHIRQTCTQLEQTSLFHVRLEYALKTVQNVLLRFSDEDYTRFSSYLKDNQLDINLLEEGSEEKLSDALRQFQEKKKD